MEDICVSEGIVFVAEEHLSYAFQRCHRDAKQNKRLILLYLLPVKMLLVSAPSVTSVYFRSRCYWSVHQVSLVFTSGQDATGQCTKCH